MPLLLKPREEIREHWFAVANEIGNILPGASRTYRPYYEETAGTVATLRCEQYPNEKAERDTGVQLSVVPLIAALPDKSPVYWMSWYEQWTPQGKGRSRQLQFLSSSITIYKGTSEAPKLQLLRAEWSGVQKIENEIDVFQGNGAAHPHWHFDALRGHLEDFGQQVANFGRDSAVIQGLVVEEFRNFGDDQAEDNVASLFDCSTLRLPDKSELNWTGIHFPAAARWHDEVWPGPEGPHHVHAHGPADLRSLRRWLTSCVRYVQAEINKTES